MKRRNISSRIVVAPVVARSIVAAVIARSIIAGMVSVALVSCAADGSDVAFGVESKTPDSVAAAVTTTIATVPPNGETASVIVLDNSYRPIEIEISAGTEVVFENRGRNEHNILPDFVKNDAALVELLGADDSPISWGVVSVELAPTMTYSHVFTAPGTYAYYCSIHGAPGAGMYGSIVVTS